MCVILSGASAKSKDPAESLLQVMLRVIVLDFARNDKFGGVFSIVHFVFFVRR